MILTPFLTDEILEHYCTLQSNDRHMVLGSRDTELKFLLCQVQGRILGKVSSNMVLMSLQL